MVKRKDNDRSRSRSDSTNEPGQPSPDEQSGSTGRNTSVNYLDPDKDTGQDRYGQSGFANKGVYETEGQANYRRSGFVRGRQRQLSSKRGSGPAEHQADKTAELSGTDTPKK